ncbi:MAG: hypothetical protein ACYS80_18240 [Planctomycetota bacterium]|jgi:hypothetical protein
MKNKGWFQKLTTRARSEAAPSVDVAGRVIAVLTAEHRLLLFP